MKYILFLHIFVISAFMSIKIYKDSTYQSRVNFLVMEMNNLETNPQQIQIKVSSETKCLKNSHNIWVEVSKKDTYSLNKQEFRDYINSQLNSCSLI